MIGVPKTIDNDLMGNDHTPGFGSAARYVSSAFAGVNLDIRALGGIFISDEVQTGFGRTGGTMNGKLDWNAHAKNLAASESQSSPL